MFGSSLTPVSGDGYRFSDPAHAPVVASFRRTFGVVAALPCDILITAHPDQSDGDIKLATFRTRPKPNPFIDPRACRSLAAKYETLLDARIARERRS